MSERGAVEGPSSERRSTETGPGGDGLTGGGLIDAAAVARGALAGLVVVVPVTVTRAVVSHHVADFDHSGWAILFFFAILFAYGLAGWVAGSTAGRAPLTNGALAGFGTILLWLPLRVLIWAIRHDHRGLFTGSRPAITLGELFGAVVLGAAIGIIGALIAARRVSGSAGSV